MILELWIHNKIRREAQEAPECGRHMAGQNLRNITAQAVRHFQLFKLQKTLNHVYQHSIFYRELYQSKGFAPDDLQSLDDLPMIPFTSPQDLWESPYKLLCVSLAEIDRIFTRVTSGTTGHPKRILFSGDDLEIITEGMVP